MSDELIKKVWLKYNNLSGGGGISSSTIHAAVDEVGGRSQLFDFSTLP
jgi:hypothetical protein